MPTKIKNQSHLVDRKHIGNIMRFVRFAMAFTVFAIFSFEATTATLRVEPTQVSQQRINRTLKGDRTAPAFSSHSIRLPESRTGRIPVINLELPDGCEPVVSRAANARLARVAGRCIS